MRLLLNFFFLLFVSLSSASLEVGFYNNKCPRAEFIVRAVVQKHFESDRTISAALLRMHFHDCFVRGCDASILINPTKNKPSEKSADPNLTVRGFTLIDRVKSRLESECPSVVSCADIITLATRDAVALAGGPDYAVPTGRRDGLISNRDDVDIPSPSFTVQQAFQMFHAKGFTIQDMVVLIGGGHSIGVAHCDFFRDRLFDFQGTGKPDPRMDSGLRAKLARHCGSTLSLGSSDPVVFLDQGSSLEIDNQCYDKMVQHKGILEIDQELALDNSTASIVDALREDNEGFLKKFADALVKLGSTDVLVGKDGEIRKSCGAVN